MPYKRQILMPFYALGDGDGVADGILSRDAEEVHGPTGNDETTQVPRCGVPLSRRCLRISNQNKSRLNTSTKGKAEQEY